MTNDFLTARSVYFRGIISIEFKTIPKPPPLIAGFVALGRRGNFGREGIFLGQLANDRLTAVLIFSDDLCFVFVRLCWNIKLV